MQFPSPNNFYTAKILHYQTDLKQLTKQIARISLARLISFLAVAGFGFYALYGDFYGANGVPHTVWNLGLLISFVVFVVLITIHARLFGAKERTESLLRVNDEELRALQGDRAHIPHGGEFLGDTPLSGSQAYSLDLDIFGHASLFQRINRTVTALGYNRLAEWLSTPLAHKEEIASRQRMILELRAATGFREEWLSTKRERDMSLSEHEGLRAWLQKENLFSTHWVLRAVIWTLPAITLICAGIAIWNVFMGVENFSWAKLVWGCMIVQFLFFVLFLRRITTEVALLKRVAGLLSVYVRLFRILREHGASASSSGAELFHEPELASMVAVSDQAWKSIRELANAMKYFEMGQNMVGAVLLNGTVFWHLHCVRLLEQWRKRHGSEVEEWLDMLARMDALCSMAGFAFNNPSYIQPVVHDSDDFVFRASGLAHPFLDANEAIRNAISLDSASGTLVVITGANMAGKSTFLRAIGINAVLALVGLPVCAASFEVSVCEVLTSMRASDSLEKHESYFYAELKRLQCIVERLRSGHRALVLLDEILRGTNSADKKSGTVGLLQQLISLPTLAVIATHDTEIGALETEYPALVRNYCFEGEIQNGELSFDYTLRRGVANNKNATFLMRQMGIVREEE